MKEVLRKFIPGRVQRWAAGLYGLAPLHPRTCPICGYHGWFGRYGRPPRVDAQCAGCGSLERHRLFWLWLKGAEIRQPVLHCAAEAGLQARLRSLLGDYRTADLFAPADLKLDLERIALPDAAVGTIIANHILEHVDDRKALPELFRVLAPGGLLVVEIPIVEGWDRTYEDASIRDPQERDLHFGQADHVRYYGRDFRDRVRAAGFQLAEYTAEGRDVITYGLMRGEKVFLCRKPA